MVAEGGGEGLFAALRELVEAVGSPWRVVYHTASQYGMTVLSRNPDDYPAISLDPWPPLKGPGTELKALLKSLGIVSTPTCDCNQKGEQMVRWGVAGCRENFPMIVKWMREGADRWGLSSILKASAGALFTGLAFRINPINPYSGLVKEAIRLAAEKEGTPIEAEGGSDD